VPPPASARLCCLLLRHELLPHRLLHELLLVLQTHNRGMAYSDPIIQDTSESPWEAGLLCGPPSAALSRC
jgi:hypothetical protein